MSVDVFTVEFTRTIARIGAVVVVLVLVYYLLSSLIRLDKSEVLGIIKDAVAVSVSSVA
jgi:hypothetical protein